MQVSGTFKATGQNVVDTAATGTVTFISGNTGNAVLVPAGTQVTTAGGLVFATNAAVTVPKATLSGLTITPRTADVAVTAVKTGPAGNVAAGAIVNVPAWLATALVVGNQVTNKQATSGGAHTVTPFVQQADIDAAEASLSTQLGTQLQTQASDPNSVAAGFEIFPRTAALGTPSYDPDPASVLNQAVESFNLSASGSGTATTANLASVRSLAQRRIEGMVQAGHSVVDGSVQVALGSPTSLGAAVSIPVKAQAMQAPAVDVAQLRNAVKGKSVEEAKAFLSQYGEAQVSVSSFWSSTVSGFDFRIDITVIAPSAAPIAAPTQRPVSTPRATGQPSGPEPIPSASLSASPGMTPEATSGTTPAITPDVTPEITPAPTDSPAAAPTETPVDTSPPTAGASPTAT